MNIDERLEALKQSVELMAAMHRDREQQQDNRMPQLENFMAQIMEATARMVRKAELH